MTQDLIGGEGNGWAVTQTTLHFERTGIGAGGGTPAFPNRAAGAACLGRRAGDAALEEAPNEKLTLGYGDVVELAQRLGRTSDPLIRQQLARLYTYSETGLWNAQRGKAEAQRGGGQAVASTGKLSQTRIVKLAAGLATEISGPRGLLWGDAGLEGGAISKAMVFSAASSIYGGTDEIQHNIIAERTLGLPREPASIATAPWRSAAGPSAVGLTNVLSGSMGTTQSNGRRSRLRTLPAAVRGRASVTTTRVGCLCAPSPADAAISSSSSDRRSRRSVTEHDDCAHRLAPHRVRRGAHGHLRDGGMAGHCLLHLARRDVLPAPDDDVLHPVGHDEVAVFVETAQVSAAEPGLVDERAVVGRRVLVAEELLGAPGHDLALLAGTDLGAPLVEKAHLVAGSHPAVGQSSLVGWVGRAARADRGVLGGPVGAPRDDPRRLAPLDQLGWHRGRAAEESLERRDVPAGTFRLVQQGGEEERGAGAGGDAVLLNELGGCAPALQRSITTVVPPAASGRSSESSEAT